MPTIASEHSQNATTEPLRFRSTSPNSMTSRGDDFEDGILPSPLPSMPQENASENVFQKSTEHAQDTKRDIGTLIRLLPPSPPQRRFDILQQWEGVVTDIDSDAVWAELRDLTEFANPAEVAELPLIEFPKADQPLIKPGSVFYWSMGYETSPGGQIRRVSEIRLRRTPEWSQHALDRMKAKARNLLVQYSSNHEDDPTTTH